MDVRKYAERCSELFAVEGYPAVRAAAREGLEKCGPDPALQRWLGQAHAAEDEDDHDRAAETAYRKGLELAPDDLGLLVSYLELCERSDTWEYPGRARRAVELRERIEALAPPGSPERAHVDAVMGWAGRGYWDDVRDGIDRARARRERLDVEGAQIAQALRDDALRRAGTDAGAGTGAEAGVGAAAAPSAPAGADSLKDAKLAAAASLLRGPWNAPLRVILAQRAAAYATTFAAALLVNRTLVATGVVRFSFWGWLLYLPLLAADARVRQAERQARDEVVARIQARHAEADAAQAAPAPAD